MIRDCGASLITIAAVCGRLHVDLPPRSLIRIGVWAFIDRWLSCTLAKLTAAEIAAATGAGLSADLICPLSDGIKAALVSVRVLRSELCGVRSSFFKAIDLLSLVGLGRVLGQRFRGSVQGDTVESLVGAI